MIKIIFEAHSTTLDNEAKRASGWVDVDLSELGIKQCLELKERYKNSDLDAIFTSDLQRAVKSGVPTANHLKIAIYPDSRLRECNYGDFDGADKSVVDGQKKDRISTPFPGGESYEDCMRRIKDFLDYLKANFDGKTVMIIGHRATQYGLEHHINGKSVMECVTEPWAWQPGWSYELR